MAILLGLLAYLLFGKIDLIILVLGGIILSSGAPRATSEAWIKNIQS